MIEYIKINSLHGERDVKLSFDGDVKILIGDNGSGKTTVLSCLYSILSLNFHKLSKIQFSSIELKFKNDELFKINKEEIGASAYVDALEHPIISDFVRFLSPNNLVNLLKLTREVPFSRLQRHPLFREIDRRTLMSSSETYERLEYASKLMLDIDEGHSVIDSKKDIIKRNINAEIMYLPTYRRVEEDLNSLGYLDEDFDAQQQLIQFGMSDVKSRFNRIRSELRDSAVHLYTELNGKMLNQLTSDYKANDEQFSKIAKIDELKIVLSRVGESISEETKKRILNLIATDEIKEDRYHPLVFVLSNLVDVYVEQKELDDSIKAFVEVTKKYLVDKEFEYDENKVDIKILNKRTKKSVSLDNLSSGEKQLVSLFSKLYIEKADKYIIIFDEPELSLSMEWQETLLPDILKTGKSKFLLVATHSPFIFDNELDLLTGSLEIDYVEAD